MFGLLLSGLQWVFGQGISSLTAAYAKAKDAQTEHERIQAEVAGKQLDARLEAQRLALQVRLATAGYWEVRLLTFLTALPFVLHAAAVGADTTLALGWKVPAYPPPFNEWEGAILLSFFGIGLVGTGIKAAATVVLSRRG